jgi:hypothetical protein
VKCFMGVSIGESKPIPEKLASYKISVVS